MLDGKKILYSGMQATGTLTLGNYLGALKNWVNLTDEYECIYGVMDLHSLTLRQVPAEFRKNARSLYALYVAAGLDPEKNCIYYQSHVSGHAELSWILGCFTYMGELNRMTQFKDKGSKGDASVGLFNYPVLMAADILLYGATYVPVGDDQTQHLELTRDIAERMNRKFGDLFIVPKPVIQQHQFFGKNQGLRIKDLVNPAKKMSKSDESGKGIIFLSDDPKSAHKKIMSATTDSIGKVQYDKENQPGISNLLEILTLVRQDAGKEVTLEQTVNEYFGMDRYGDFKRIVADEVAEFLENFQNRLAAVDERAIEEKLASSEKDMNVVANETLYRVQKAIGLRK